ncbi:MAG: putative rane protein [Frankiales bacterium]|nr:putative rane protein [Frankiales bacterium]
MTTLHLHAPLVGRAAAEGRTLAGYLLLPRPKDLVKALIVPLTFTLGALVEGGVDADRVGVALLVWAALELLVYQARYQWNDVRGFEADQRHPDGAARGRLPGPVERGRQHKAVSTAVAVLRIALTGLLALAVPTVATLLLLLTVGVFAIAAVYEALRSAATGRCSEVPCPLSPPLVGLWVFVGAGYALRGMTGLALATDLTGEPAAAAVAALAMWSLGVVFVTARWTLEAMPFATLVDRRVSWACRAEQAREHTLGLVRWVAREADPRDLGAPDEPAHWRALHGRTPLTAPWNVAILLSGACAALAGHLLTGGDAGAVVLLAGAAGALAVVLAERRRLEASVGAAAALVVVQAALGTPAPVVASVPWLVVLLAHASFTSQCTADLGHPLHRLSR